MDSVKVVTAHKLSMLIRSEKALIIDSRTFCEFNTSHILNSVNVWSSKIRKKRLQQDSISVHDYLTQACHLSELSAGVDIIVYDHSAPSLSAVPQDSFLHVLLTKLGRAFPGVFLLAGGFLEFQARYPELCEDSSKKGTPLTTQSQPCMPVANIGPTRILPFLYLGSQNDANNRQLLQGYNILYELNVSVTCPKPDFVQDSYFMRIPVNDNFSEKLLPYFNDAFNFIDKVREGGGCVLVHCLAGVSRSATVAIAYVMKHLTLPFEEAYMYVKTRRPTISPNINFVGQLAELDRQLRRHPGVPRDPVSAPVLLRPQHTPSQPNPAPPSPTACPDRPPCGPLAKSLSLNLRGTLDGSPASPRSPTDLSPSTALARLTFPPSTPPRSPRSPIFNLKRGSTSSPSTPVPCPFFRGRTGSLRGTSKVVEAKETTGGRGITTPVSPSKAEAPGTPPALPRPRQVSVCVIEVHTGADPVRYVKGEPMVVRETPVEATPVHSNTRCHLHVDVSPRQPPKATQTQPKPTTTPTTPVTALPHTPLTPITPNTPSPAPREVIVPIKREVPLPATTPRQGNAPKSGGVWSPECPKEGSVPGPPAARPGSPTSQGVQQSDSGILVAGGASNNPPCNTPRLPRCYSSSETHLSTRRVLEHLPPDFSARKCSSYDEVGRAWPLCPPTTQSQSRTWELARSDSVSTSGFGSEISDSDFLAEDAPQPHEDPLGPFQAVFADVFPGEGAPGTPVHHHHHRQTAPITTSSHKATRPASLPGVTGTYFTHIQNDPSLDMGVELDRDEEEEEEEEVELRGGEKERRGVEKKDSGYYSFLTEHPPANSRTMGEGLRHTSSALKSTRQIVQDVEKLVDSEMTQLRKHAAFITSHRLFKTPTDDPISRPIQETPHPPTRPPRGFKPGDGRARSEPPVQPEEGLYRARSYPGLPRPVTPRETETGHLTDMQLVRLRGTRREAAPAPPRNRYSCGALDVPAPSPAAAAVTFESCPDFGSLRQCVRQTDSHHSSSSSISSTHSFTRLLQVS